MLVGLSRSALLAAFYIEADLVKMNSDIEAVIEVHNHEIALVSVVETRRQIFLSRSGFPVALQLGAPVRREILDQDSLWAGAQ